jgi:hypothetical protein
MSAETSKAKSHTYCKFCKAMGIKRVATRMTRYAPRMGMRDTYKHYACEDHVELMVDTDPQRTRGTELMELKAVKRAPDTEYSEADYQTWLRV